MIQLSKGEETTQCTVEQKAYILLPPKMRNSSCEIKKAKSLDFFKENIKLSTTGKCPWRLCKRYIGNVDFV